MKAISFGRWLIFFLMYLGDKKLFHGHEGPVNPICICSQRLHARLLLSQGNNWEQENAYPNLCPLLAIPSSPALTKIYLNVLNLGRNGLKEAGQNLLSNLIAIRIQNLYRRKSITVLSLALITTLPPWEPGKAHNVNCFIACWCTPFDCAGKWGTEGFRS